MTPTPQDVSPNEAEPKLPGDRIVISGMAGLYPEAYNVKELQDILYNKVNPVTSENCRWKYDHPEVSQYTGKVPDLEYFDGQFFKVHYRLGNTMDSMSRKVLEQAFQAIYDSGVSSDELSGKKIAVYMGTCFSEAEKANFYMSNTRTGFGIMGCSKSMFANRISYWLNAKGPSMSVDQACCSSTVALELAYNSILHGEVDAAIVGGASLCLLPQSSVHLRRVLLLNKDGKTRSFDKNACGCNKSEAINVLFLQRAKDALRVYAEVVNVKSEFTGLLEDENGPKFGFYRNPAIVTDFLKNFYKESKVAPEAVEYVEAVGSAEPENDKMELEVINEVFCKKRNETLLVGSVMSNIGYGEAASGTSAITKVLLGYEKGEIASNINCENPRDDVSGLREGKMSIVTDHKPFKRGYVAVNGLSVTGVNSHVLLHGHHKPKDINRYKSSIPHLVTISGRQQSAVEKILKDLKSRPIDPEELALFHNIHKNKISAHLGRGFTILDTNEKNETISVVEKADYYDDATRPLWFVYSGMGSQWAGMGTQLMRIPIFAAAIERCHLALKPKGLDIVHIITSPDKTIMDNILHCFVGIAAVQIGLTDILKELGIVPDKIIGHSVGELGCAYADGCLTAEEMILSAYSRGLVSVQTPFIKGSMAAVGMGYKQVSKMVPPEIEIACHNSSESSTISGPADVMKQFVESLTAKGIFAKEVPCSNIAYHSRYIAEAGPGLLKYLNEVITTPRLRSDRWVSTSIPQDRWDEPLAKYSSAEYHTNNLLNSVLFEETSELIPKNAVVVEVAPHGLLQAILKRSLSTCTNIALTRRGHADNAVLLLEAVGKLYMEGYNPKVQVLYPKVEFPVSTGTPMLGHLVEWAHTEKWNLPLYVSSHKATAAACKFLLSTYDDEHSYLRGHIIKEKNLYPFSAALVAVWDTFAMNRDCGRGSISVQFDDVYFLVQPVLRGGEQFRLSVDLHRGTGKFEVMNENMVIVTGYISAIEKGDNHRLFKMAANNDEPLTLKSDDIYKLLYTRDFNYRDVFQSIEAANTSLTEASIQWKNNWVTFIDGLLQLNALKQTQKSCSQPEFARKIIINIDEHKIFADNSENTSLRADVFEVNDFTRSGGVIIENLRFRNISVNKYDKISLKSLQFVPHFTKDRSNEISAIYTYLQMVAENINKEEITVVEIVDAKDSKFNELPKVIEDVPGLKIKYSEIREKDILNQDTLLADVIFVNNLSVNDTLCKTLNKILPQNKFIVNKEVAESKTRPSSLYSVVSLHNVSDMVIQLMKWQPANKTPGTSVVTVRSESDLSHLISTLDVLPTNQKMIVFSLYPPINNLENIVKEWRKAGRDINLLMINDQDNEEQQVEALPKSDFAIAVLNKGIWGGNYYLPVQNSREISNGVILQSGQIGDIDSLKWVEAPVISDSALNVTVHYAGINEVDVKRSLGVVSFKDDPNKSYYGMDFSGETNNGTKVMGLISEGSASSKIKANPNLLWPVPEHWTLEEAATVPLAYSLALYCLAIKAKLISGMNVLIHGGSGALGQAAISICLASNCEVFTTVADSSKKHFLKRLFPQLKDSNIGNSRDITFGDMVLSNTKGEGCDIIINCVKGELKNISLNCCAASGVLIDTGLLQNKEKYIYGMNSMTKSRSFSAVDFSSIFKSENEEELRQLQVLISEGIAKGYVRPLTRIIYSPEDVSRAFRLVSASRHRGRVLINLKQNIVAEKNRLNISPDKYHVVISDEDVLAMQFVDRLVDEGAKKLQLICLKMSNCLMYKIRLWKEAGVQIELTVEDVWNKTKIPEILDDNIKQKIEGIYIIIKNNGSDSEKVIEFLENLDSSTKKGCSKLRYFAIINEDGMIGDKICLSRRKNLQPGTLVKLPHLKRPDDVNVQQTTVSFKNAVDAIEQALLSQHAVTTANVPITNALLTDEIAALAGIKITKDLDVELTLQDLGMDSIKSQSVQAFLRDQYFISVEEDQVPHLTIQRLRELEEMTLEREFKDPKGLATFISTIDSDELLATTEMVFLPTLTNTTAMRHSEFDASQIFLCIVPGLEGNHQRFTNMCSRLKLPAMVLQPKLGRTQESLHDTAQRYAEILLNQTDLKHFYLLGYESGVCVALEMAAILESKGLTGVVYCLGGSPKEIKQQIDSQLSEFKDEESLKEGVAKHIMNILLGDTEFIESIFQESTTCLEKVDRCVRHLIGKTSHSAQFAKEVIEGVYFRINQTKEYSLRPLKMESKIVLLRANLSEEKLFEGDNSLQDYSVHPVTEYDLDAPLAFAAQDLRCACFINRHLDRDILEAFENKNLCETYEINTDGMLSTN